MELGFDFARRTEFAGPTVVWGFRETVSACFYMERKAAPSEGCDDPPVALAVNVAEVILRSG